MAGPLQTWRSSQAGDPPLKTLADGGKVLLDLEKTTTRHRGSLHRRRSYVIPVVQSRQVNPPLGVHVFALSDDHAGRGLEEAYGGGEGERVQEPQLDGEVVGATWGWGGTKSEGARVFDVGHRRRRLPSYLTGMTPVIFRRSFWVLSLNAEGRKKQREGIYMTPHPPGITKETKNTEKDQDIGEIKERKQDK